MGVDEIEVRSLVDGDFVVSALTEYATRFLAARFGGGGATRYDVIVTADQLNALLEDIA